MLNLKHCLSETQGWLVISFQTWKHRAVMTNVTDWASVSLSISQTGSTRYSEHPKVLKWGFPFLWTYFPSCECLIIPGNAAIQEKAGRAPGDCTAVLGWLLWFLGNFLTFRRLHPFFFFLSFFKLEYNYFTMLWRTPSFLNFSIKKEIFRND